MAASGLRRAQRSATGQHAGRSCSCATSDPEGRELPEVRLPACQRDREQATRGLEIHGARRVASFSWDKFLWCFSLKA